MRLTLRHGEPVHSRIGCSVADAVRRYQGNLTTTRHQGVSAMPKEVIEVPVLSETIRKLGVPLSLVTRANGLVYVSGMPPLDLATGKLIRGDIEVQTDASLKAVQFCLETAGTSLAQALMVRV